MPIDIGNMFNGASEWVRQCKFSWIIKNSLAAALLISLIIMIIIGLDSKALYKKPRTPFYIIFCTWLVLMLRDHVAKFEQNDVSKNSDSEEFTTRVTGSDTSAYLGGNSKITVNPMHNENDRTPDDSDNAGAHVDSDPSEVRSRLFNRFQV